MVKIDPCYHWARGHFDQITKLPHRGGRSTPHFSKFQIFFKNFPALPLGKIASNFKTMREFHSLKLPRASSDRNIRALRLLFRSVIGFHNLTANIFTAKPRYAQGLLRYDNACFNDYADN